MKQSTSLLPRTFVKAHKENPQLALILTKKNKPLHYRRPEHSLKHIRRSHNLLSSQPRKQTASLPPSRTFTKTYKETQQTCSQLNQENNRFITAARILPCPRMPRLYPPTTSHRLQSPIPSPVSTPPSKRILPQRKEPLRHRFQMPNPLPLFAKHFLPLPLQFPWQLPPHLIIANPHAHQVSLLLLPLG